MTGAEMIARERQEQIDKHGFDEQHDKQNTNGELVSAAAYLITGEDFHWPDGWDRMWKLQFDDKTQLQQLIVAGALIAAEIDRLQAQ